MSSKKVKKIGEQIVFLNTTLTAISIIIFSFISYITFTGHNIKKEVFEMYILGDSLVKDFSKLSFSEIKKDYKELIYEDKEEIIIWLSENNNEIIFGKKLDFINLDKPTGWYYKRGEGLYRYKKCVESDRIYIFFRNIEILEILEKGLKLLLIDFLFIILTFIITTIGAKRILEPLSAIIDKAKLIDENNLDVRLPKKTDDELGELVEVINNSIEKIQKSYKIQKSFTHNASHELKTPLAIMKGYLQILHWGKTDPILFNESLENAEGEIENMTNIIDRLFLLSKFENIELNISTIKISELFNKIVSDYKILGINRIQISRDFGEINADKKLFLEGIRILVDNALKFSEKEIILDSYSDDDFHYISVKDFGVGIEEKETGKIFERFYKIDESRNSKNNGLGLGLSIIEEIVKAHSGKLIIDSKVNVGSSFIIRIRKYICQN